MEERGRKRQDSRRFAPGRALSPLQLSAPWRLRRSREGPEEVENQAPGTSSRAFYASI